MLLEVRRGPCLEEGQCSNDQGVESTGEQGEGSSTLLPFVIWKVLESTLCSPEADQVKLEELDFRWLVESEVEQDKTPAHFLELCLK